MDEPTKEAIEEASMNGHKMRSLLVPAHRGYCRPDAYTDYLHDYWMAVFNRNGSAEIHLIGGRVASTDARGGKRLHNTKGEQVPYTGQSFVLTVPEFALSAKGLAAADEFDRSNHDARTD